MSLSQYEIARRTGFSRSTVSRALSNHPAISQETRDAVQQVAAELGYRKNALVSMLTSQLRTSRAKTVQQTIAYLASGDVERADKENPEIATRYFNGVTRRTEELGFNLDVIPLFERGMTGRKLQNLLRTRSIRGILIGPRRAPLKRLSVNWSYFAPVAVAHALPGLEVHYTSPLYFNNLGIALRSILKMNYRRIGFAVSRRTDQFASLAFSARYAIFSQEHPQETRIPVLSGLGYDDHADIGLFGRWFELHRPDVVIHAGATLPFCMRELGLRAPQDVALCDLLLPMRNRHLAGIDQREEIIGASAVDLVVEQLHNHQLGLPANPKAVFTQGVWKDGPTLPINPRST